MIRNEYNFSDNKLDIVTNGGLHFSLCIRDYNTQTIGASGVGKTFLIDYVRDVKLTGLLGNVIIFDKEHPDDILRHNSCLVLVDNADMLCNGLLNKLVWDRENKHLIFARKGLGIGVMPNCFGEFIQRDSLVSIKYLHN